MPLRTAQQTLEYNSDQQFGRAVLLSAAAICLTTLLLHPAVPTVFRAVRSWLPLTPSQDFGYPAHVTAYLIFGALAVRLLRPQTRRGLVLILGGLFAHGISTECSQLAVEGRTFDLLDMTCNLTAATAGVFLACPASKLSTASAC